MKTLLTLLAVWLGLGLFATAIYMFFGWLDYKADPDDATEEDSRS